MHASPAETEKRSFNLHPNMIWQVISSQAGSIGKGLLEVVMNSIDAGATEIRITVTPDGYAAFDNGRGFNDMEEITQFFETFGFPHEAEDHRQYGRFGQGRAQLWSFGSAIWRTAGASGTGFVLDVDVKARGLDYHLQRDVPGITPGCTILGQWYEPLKPSQVDAEVRALTEMVLYAPVPVQINGRIANKDVSSVIWTVETEEAYIKLAPTRSALEVYNLGVKVRDYPGYQFGTGGTVVSKKPLELNVARNDVLLGRCAVFRRVRAILEENSGEVIRRNGALNESEREYLARELLSGGVTLDEAWDQRLITDVRGRHWPVSALLLSGNPASFTVSPTEGSQLAETVHLRKLAFVVSPKTLARFGVDDAEAWLERLAATRTDDSSSARVLERIITLHAPFAQFADLLREGFETLDDKALKPGERMILQAVNTAQHPVPYAFRSVGQQRAIRRVRAGLSETALAWTDGSDYICLNRDLLTHANRGAQGMAALAGLLVHEYIHDRSDTEAHAHGPEFYELYESLVADPTVNLVGELTNAMLSAYTAALRQANRRMPHRIVREEDRAAQIARLSDSVQ